MHVRRGLRSEITMYRDTSSEKRLSSRARIEAQAPLVRFDTFIQAIRDSGYKGPASALAELVDNAIEAGAKHVAIDLITGPELDAVSLIRVIDDGVGMSPDNLQTALQFGGSSRFNSRESLGRYGMGLPCSALSLAERVDIWTWRSARTLWRSYLDVAEISARGINAVPQPARVSRPAAYPGTPSGTMVELSRCDRLDPCKLAALSRLLPVELGRIFRHRLVQGIALSINGKAVEPIDPLFLTGESKWAKGVPFGPPLRFPIKVPNSRRTSEVIVAFSELPVTKWFNLANKTKRQLGIANGAGVSIVRLGREVDYGWLFMGRKRRENYDDWWRCEIRYEPTLDELFGLTHTKQRIRPTQSLEAIITPETEAVARTLNARVRAAFLNLKTDSRILPSERRAGAGDLLLDPPTLFLDRLNARPTQNSSSKDLVAGLHYDLTLKPLKTGAMFEAALRGSTVEVKLNTRHVFYEQVYERIKKQHALRSCDAITLLELLMLAYGRAELSATSGVAARHAAKLRSAWSDVLTSFLG